ncbi:hypothetical protein ALT_6643 [Aspergillus lentulus]|uniref:Uncharacterized protein n=1 Tax=Aspergillus lentulus TaxID=293939 RepID=A0AAN4TCX9_ASPLE|nr:uncharacterized protein IFM58399_03731 [Aspergillus lentulus]KAF4152703.1 hypothetical protein CNMCM6069_001805 [Aspergillus lentulus]KAF4164442.1 hypothetical protein CNMCM6936_009104 [Aspergillus lentulus]KAF4181591.1 hypothetical protein CNMCM8060_008758 [Aspergillus lentulus]KAF4188716.1 hypothetical protein CNMCM7927_000890 [Aspergillus lentulus]KAF4191943.1 hypothetical protein CNMCM8694_001068 [Aspergillus lentulus]
MLQDCGHSSMPGSTAVVIDNLEPTSIPTASVAQDNCRQPDEDIQPSHQNAVDTPPTPSSQITDTLTPLAERNRLTSAHTSFHRRANTEIIRRQPHLSVKQLFADQPKTFEDLVDGDRSSSPALENPTRKTLEVGARLLSGWFQGKSEPVNLTMVPQSADQDALGLAPSGAFLNRASKRASSPLKQVTSTNPFNFFAFKRPGEGRPELPEPADDEILNMDITAALFPPESLDLDGQEAFSALRTNADNLLRRLQAAYKERTFALHEALADKNEKQEELEETRTRVGHLKVQLDGMAEKVLHQEKAMKAMAEELEQERQLRRREDARRRSVMLVRSSDEESLSDVGAELQTPKRSLKRASNGTYTSDSGFDSGDESLAESIFSRRDGLESPTPTIPPSPNISQIALSVPTSTTIQPSTKESKLAQAPPVRQSTYDRVLKGLASTGITSSWMGHTSKCNICHGVPASEAWGVLGVIKEENRGLKLRLSELELVVDDCLSLVGS